MKVMEQGKQIRTKLSISFWEQDFQEDQEEIWLRLASDRFDVKYLYQNWQTAVIELKKKKQWNKT